MTHALAPKPVDRVDSQYSGTVIEPDTLPVLIEEANVSRWIGVKPPPLVFAWDSILPEGMASVLIGPGGAGKTMLMQTLQYHVATGRPFLGKATKQGASIGFYSEDDDAVLHNRHARLCESFDIDESQLDHLAFVRSCTQDDVVLWHDGRPTKLAAAMEADFARVPDLRLIAFDSVTQVYAGNMNDIGEVGKFLRWWNALSERLKIATVFSTHISKSSDDSSVKSAAGAVAWINQARSALRLTPGDNDRTKLAVIKANHAKLQDFQLEWRDGCLKGYDAGGTVESIERNARHKRAEQAFKDGLAKLHRINVRATTAIQGAYAPRLMKQHAPECAGDWQTKDLADAMSRLLSMGSIVNVPYGPPSRDQVELRLEKLEM